MKACKNCHYISDKTTCPLCNNILAKNWKGYLVIFDNNNSEIAKRLNIKVSGKYALIVM